MRFIWSIFSAGIVISFLTASVCAAKAPVGSEFQVNTYTTDDQCYPAVSACAKGSFVVTWSSYQQDGDRFGVYAQMFNADGTRSGNEFRVNTYTQNNQSYTKVGMFSTGEFVVVWQSYGQDGDGYGIYGQLYSATGSPVGTEFLVNTNTTGSQKAPSVAVCDSGFVVVWQAFGYDGSDYGIFGQLYNKAGNPIGGEFQINTYTQGNQTTPAVAMATDGSFVVAWQSYNQDGSAYGIYAQRFDSTTHPLGVEFRVNSYTQNTQREPSISIDRQGNFVIVWQSYGQDGDAYGIYGQLFDSNGNTVGAEFQVNTHTAGNQDSPAVCYAPNSEFIVTWSSFAQDGDYYGVYAQRFSQAGVKLGAEYQVNTYTASSQRNSVISIDGDGNSVIVWQSYGQDGSKYGIFAQRYDNVVIPEFTMLTIPLCITVLWLAVARRKF